MIAHFCQCANKDSANGIKYVCACVHMHVIVGVQLRYSR